MADGESLEFFDDIFHLMVKECLVEGSKRENKVLEYIAPNELKNKLDLDIKDESTDYKSLLEICKSIVQYSVRTVHPRHLLFFYSGFSPAGIAGSWLTDALNANIHNYEAAPVFIVIENFVIAELNKLVGFPDGDGIFVPGSSYGNCLALHLARYNYKNDIKQTGLFGLPRLCFFTSEEAHYSTVKAASFLGFGTDSVIQIETNEGKMKVDLLEKAIIECKSAGMVPLMVVATLGTTVTGGFDPVDEIADVCQRHGIWLHGDAAWGGGILFSEKYKGDLTKGLGRCDSMVWSLHKLMGAPIQCAVILTKKKGQLEACNSSGASYLFASDKFYDISYDIGDKTIQCGRKVDCLKFWMMWKSRGNLGMAQHVDAAFDNAK